MSDAQGGPRLLLGPMLRYVDRHEATVWVETDRACTVTLQVEGDTDADTVRVVEPTWAVHGHHYALLQVTGLETGTVHPYTVTLDESPVWPEPGSPYPRSVIRTLDPGSSVRLAFGSCRRVAPFDRAGLREVGADSLVALAERMCSEDHEMWPDAILMAGDQIYADEPSEALVERLRESHAGASPGRREVEAEVWDFEEYTWLYHESWSPPPVRWLLSTVSSCMLLDDHDLRDDWNTSLEWRQEVTGKEWWRDRVVGAFGSYWVYQHLGNLSPEALTRDQVFARMRTADDDASRTEALDDFAWRTDAEVGTARWSYVRDFGDETSAIRLVAIDCRASRHLERDHRVMIDDHEWDWIVEQATSRPEGAPITHLLIGATLPFFLPRGIHHLEGWNEAAASGSHGRFVERIAEWSRQAVDLEHWSAFRTSFRQMVDLLRRIIDSPTPPRSVLFLSGDVHCSYIARAQIGDTAHPRTTVAQLTMSPFRNALPLPIKAVHRLSEHPAVRRPLRRLSRSFSVSDTAASWSLDTGPWFRNGLMTVVLDGRRVTLEVDTAEHDKGRQYLRRAGEHPLTT